MTFNLMHHTGYGQYVANEDHLIVHGIPNPRDKAPIVYAHGVFGTAFSCLYDGGPNTPGTHLPLTAEIVEKTGLPLISGDYYGNYSGNSTVGTGTWGNDTSAGKVASMITYANQRFGTRTDRVHLMGTSMGATTVMRYAKLNPSKIASILLVIPCVNTEDIRANNRGTAFYAPGYQPSIENAYGNNAGWQASRPTNNPIEIVQNDASVRNIPCYIANVSGDTIATHASVLAFQSAYGSKCTVNTWSSSDHSLVGVPWEKCVDFIRANP